MNSIQKINAINQKELESNVGYSASWHADYKDTPYIFIGFLPQELEEPDIILIFSQYGIPTHINLVKDRETGKSRGFCYLKYEDYRSCVLAIDNFNGLAVFDKKLKVDHVRYKLRDDEDEENFIINYDQAKEELLKIDSKEKKLLHDKPEEFDNDEFKDPLEDFKDPMENYLRDKSPRRSDRSKDKNRSDRHISDSRRSDRHRSDRHRSDRHRSDRHRSDRHRSERHRSERHRSEKEGSGRHRSEGEKSHKPTSVPDED